MTIPRSATSFHKSSISNVAFQTVIENFPYIDDVHDYGVLGAKEDLLYTFAATLISQISDQGASIENYNRHYRFSNWRSSLFPAANSWLELRTSLYLPRVR